MPVEVGGWDIVMNMGREVRSGLSVGFRVGKGLGWLQALIC